MQREDRLADVTGQSQIHVARVVEPLERAEPARDVPGGVVEVPGPPNLDHLRGGIEPGVERGDAGSQRERVGARADDQLEPADGGSLDQEGRLGGGFGGLAGRRLRLERPVGPSLRAGFEQNVDVVDHDIQDSQGARPQRNGIDGDPDPARPNHERLGPPGSVGERNVGGLERRGEGERQAEGAGDLHLAPDGLAGDSLNGSAQPSGYDRSRRRTRGDHPGGEGDQDEETPPPRGHAPRGSVPSCHRAGRVGGCRLFVRPGCSAASEHHPQRSLEQILQ